MGDLYIAKVAVDNAGYSFDMFFSYLIPQEFLKFAGVGSRVLVPFGYGDRKRQGIVAEVVVVDSLESLDFEASKIKNIYAVLDEAPLLNDEMMKLACFMKEKYFCGFFEVVKCVIPGGLSVLVEETYVLCGDRLNKENLELMGGPGRRVISALQENNGRIKRDKLMVAMGPRCGSVLAKLELLGVVERLETYKKKAPDAMVKIANLACGGGDFEVKLTSKQAMVCEFLRERAGEAMPIKEISYFTGVGAGVVATLIKKGVLSEGTEQIYRIPYSDVGESQQTKISLTQEQEHAYKSLFALYSRGKYAVSLLFGVTGSGKTSVFMRLIDDAHRDGKDVIVMVPEIALTEQLVKLFKRRFGDKVAVFHSRLSAGERMDEFKRIREGKVSIAVGTRSAIFVPFTNIGLVIMDEEHEHTYKSDAAPRFHARDIAKFRCHYNGALLVLSSATPSVESYYFAKTGVYTMNKLTSRYGNANLPEVTIVDMNEEPVNSVLSRELIERLSTNIKSGNQSVLLLNRRGYSTFVKCRACNEVVTCPNCSISMTYHKANGRLMCHYCAHSMKISDLCPNCGQPQLKYLGAGTQRLEQELVEALPGVRLLRMDADTTTSKNAHVDAIRDFAAGKFDIMLGTQMVAKGLDFPKVTLVGVISVDGALYSNDFRGYERAFSLITQVVGRAGRAEDKGFAVIQTYTPENEIIKLAAEQDYESFWESEIKTRSVMIYPPFCKICVVWFLSEDEDRAVVAAREFFVRLRDIVRDGHKNMAIKVLGPSPAHISRVNKNYRFKVVIKFRDEEQLRAAANSTLTGIYSGKCGYGVNIFVDINPDVVM